VLYTVALLPLVVMTGCAEGGGVRVEGSAPASVLPPVGHSGSLAPKVNPVTLLQRDPKVDDDIKDHLHPCGGDEYPIDTSYGNVTGAATPDLVINVSTCSDGVGLGSYVYRMRKGRYVDVFGDDQSPVYIDIVQGELELTRQVYSRDDGVCCPSGEDVIMYRWTGSRFVETSHTHNEYGTKTG
jgi:hypothetical protein